ncbi:hypothetical protein PDIDSM_1788 [Penicillium digitatum]|nr:hypothetical protein PDIDSM_1788 [Penicillium digitatum]
MENSADRPEVGDTNQGSTPHYVLGIPRPPSVGGISSRVTDEDGERTSSYTSPPPPLQSLPSVSSKRGPPPVRNSINAASQVASRPGSSGSRLSRSHIPSLTAQAFFRPMSSQRLQAHRGTRPVTKGTISSTDDSTEHGSHNRGSLVSNSTVPQGFQPPADMEAPPSRGTDVRLLRDRNQKEKPPRLNLGANYTGLPRRTHHQNRPCHSYHYKTGVMILGAVKAMNISPPLARLQVPSTAPWLWHNISPAIPIVFAYIFYVCLSSFVHASVVDPGIMPRNVHPMPPPEYSDDPLVLGPPTNDWVMVKLATSDVAAMDVPVKYCKTCSIWRPPRCYHCRVCNNCVETLDHHCVWLNNCVGRRNYRYFFTFISSCTILAIFLIGASLAHILVSGKHIIRGCNFQMESALGHVGRGETTREYLNSHKFAKPDRHRPFTQGNILKNWIAVFGRPRPPTYMEFKRRHEDGDQRLDLQRRKYRVPDVESQSIEMEHVGPQQD